jgi:predicted nucleic acid-binding protein
MSDRVFVDSSVLVYAHDRSAGERHRVARDLVLELWRQRTGVVSTQVLQEVVVNLRRLAGLPLKPDEARAVIQDYLAWEVVVNDTAAVLEAMRFEELYGLSFRDALVVHAANAAGASTLLSEELSHGQRYGQVVARNPFADL